MRLLQRLNNAVKTGGIQEVVRKLYWKKIYTTNNRRTLEYVNQSEICYGLNTSEKRNEKIIISLTSFPSRLPTLHKCLKSLLLQDTKADAIVVYFGCDVKPEMLTPESIELEKYGVAYRFDSCENLRSYKKFYYALQDYPNDTIITVDDDVYYPRYWLTSFLAVHNRFPGCVCAWRLHKMRSHNGELLPYNQWFDQYRGCLTPSLSLFPTGVGGILYPPGSLHSNVLNKDTFTKLCFTCDDIWLKVMCVLNGTKTVWVPSKEIAFCKVEKIQEYALFNENVGESANDVALKKVMAEFSVTPDMFFE